MAAPAPSPFLRSRHVAARHGGPDLLLPLGGPSQIVPPDDPAGDLADGQSGEPADEQAARWSAASSCSRTSRAVRGHPGKPKISRTLADIVIVTRKAVGSSQRWLHLTKEDCGAVGSALMKFVWAHKVLAGALVMVAGSGLAVAIGSAVAAADTTAVITAVVDGDTIDVDYGRREARVRLLNVDTPETVDPDEAVQCLGPEATQFLRAMLPVGTEVTLEYDVERLDRYGRELAGVFKDGSLVNAEIARQGLGVAVVYEPNDRFYPDVLAAQDEAVAAASGLYSPAIGCTIPAKVEAYEDGAEEVADKAAIAEGRSVDELLGYGDLQRATMAAGRDLERILASDGGSFPMLIFAARNGAPGYGHAEVVRRVEVARERVATSTVTISEALQAERARLAEEARKAEARRVAAEAEAQRVAAEAEARRVAEEAERERLRRQAADRAGSSSSSSGSSGSSGRSGSGGGDSYTGCRAYEPGGKTYKPIPCP
ncbi:thermonuclease family protein [Georgenia sp. AZ-5]|uniref:thermonuclease family protein n=1 Tax=Georgenia sp. AZ-5 TaxID=3367526 RepID=UPI003754CF9B